MLIKFTSSGIYCPLADVYVDPSGRVENALITHSHSDHAKRGHGNYLTFSKNVLILRHRLGRSANISGLDFGRKINMNGVGISFHPAGHVPGSCQIRIEYKGEVCVVSGDYKTEPDGLCEEFEVLKCNTFVTESTFALPVFDWKPQIETAESIVSWWNKNAGNDRISILFAYSLGKAQRLLKMLEDYHEKIFVHPSIKEMNDVVKSAGYRISECKVHSQHLSRNDLQGALLIVPPAAVNSNVYEKLKPFETAFASGWMGVKGNGRRQLYDTGFAVSDHADWKGLNNAVSLTEAENVIVNHGFSDVFAKWLREKGLNAYEQPSKHQSSLTSD